MSAAADRGRDRVAPELLAWFDAFPNFELTTELLALMRQGIGAALTRPPLTPKQEAVRCEERHVPGPAGAPDVRVLVYTPPGDAVPRPALLHFHGGGYVLGTPELNDGPNRERAAELDCVIVSVDYRLAPETRFPGAVEDGYAALAWLHAEAVALGIDTARIAIGGESAGAGHAATLARLARDRGEIPICLQILDSPMLDDRTGSSVAPHENGAFTWSTANNRFGWQAMLGVEPGGVEVQAGSVPARCADLSGLPPSFVIIGALDLFLEESVDYARRLIRAGVPTELHVIPGAFHGYAFTSEAPQVKAHNRLIVDALARAFTPAR